MERKSCYTVGDKQPGIKRIPTISFHTKQAVTSQVDDILTGSCTLEEHFAGRMSTPRLVRSHKTCYPSRRILLSKQVCKPLSISLEILRILVGCSHCYN